jgi:ribonuclease BN (tRNA processing enzyme)
MNLRILGSGLSFPNPGGASSGYLVESPNTHLLLDCGHGIAGKLPAAIDLRQLSTIVISHMHPDHFLDLVPLKYAFFFQGIPPIPLYLPPGGVDALERLQNGLRLSERFFADSFDLDEYDPDATLHAAGLSIEFAPTQHYIPGYCTRIVGTDGPAALFYSSDTAWTDPVLELARGATLGLIEATLMHYDPREERHGHLTAEMAGKLAREAGLKRLVLTHYFSAQARRLQAEAEKAFGGHVDLAEEGQSYPID